MDPRFASMLAGVAAAGLGTLYLAAPERMDLLGAAASGAAFGGALSVAAYEAVRRAARTSMHRAVQVFLAAMTVKVLAFAAFLLTTSLTTSLDPAATASGLAGITLVGEALAIEGVSRLSPRGGGEDPGRESRAGEEGPGAPVHRDSE